MKKRLIYSAVTLILFFLVLEIGARVAYFQLRGYHATALQSGVAYLCSWRPAAALKQKKVELLRFKESIRGLQDALYGPEGSQLLDQFFQVYESHFQTLVSAARRISSRLIVLYLPSRSSSEPTIPETYCRPFFRALAERFDVEFLDLTDTLVAHPVEHINLLPVNGHLSRFGNQLVARGLLTYIRLYPATGRSKTVYDGTPKRCGDLDPNSSSIWRIVDTMPYAVIANAQGFRMSRPIEIPKSRTRILCLGDSFTFGPYLPNHDTYPELLNTMDTSLEAINAGIAGYTITDEASLFIERSQYVGPDITVLQVLDNDIEGLFWFRKNEFDRKRVHYEPSRLEKEFIDKLIMRNSQKQAPIGG